MSPRIRLSTLKFLVILFPLGAGLFLTVLGAAKLSEANIVPIKQWTTPYGFLVFSSTQLQSLESHVWIEGINIKDDTVICNIPFSFRLTNASSEEQILGFQLPCTADFLTSMEPGESSFSINGTIGDDLVRVELVDEKAVLIGEEKISIVYARFVALQNVVDYSGRLYCNSKGLTSRQGFSTYNMVFSISKSKPSAHESIFDYCPRAYTYYGKNLTLLVGMTVPQGCEVRQMQPSPSGEHVFAPMEHVSGDFSTRLVWYNLSEFGSMEFPHPASESLTVSIESLAESELRNRLLFDSGLYMGLGVGLIFSGIHELLKVASEVSLHFEPSKKQVT
jgi:hypothetical protein